MQAERDHLVRLVFPELEQRCLARGGSFVAVDLRWGVTEEEAENGQALGICLEEIEQCRPFFVCLLGERYGWKPLPPTVGQESAAGLDPGTDEGRLFRGPTARTRPSRSSSSVPTRPSRSCGARRARRTRGDCFGSSRRSACRAWGCRSRALGRNSCPGIGQPTVTLGLEAWENGRHEVGWPETEGAASRKTGTPQVEMEAGGHWPSPPQSGNLPGSPLPERPVLPMGPRQNLSSRRDHHDAVRGEPIWNSGSEASNTVRQFPP